MNDALKARWESLQPRERVIISVAGVLLLLVIVYQFLFSPIHHGLSRLHTTVTENQQLLTWMANTQQHIHTLSKSSTSAQRVEQSSLLSTVDESVHESPIAAHVTALQQGTNQAVVIKFNNVNFDALTTWLISLRKEYNIEAKQVVITQISHDGEVQASIDLVVHG